jgi:hypothetical protein
MSEKNLHFLLGLEEYCDFKGEPDLQEKVHQLVNILRSDDIEEALIRNFFKTTYHGSNLKHFRSINKYFKENEDVSVINDAFSRGQIRSKVWLLEELRKINKKFDNIALLAGWMGQLVDLLERSIQFTNLRNIELDRQSCLESDYNFNLDNLNEWRVKSVCADINNLTAHQNGYELNVENFKTNEIATEKFLPNLIINTSSEHMSDEWYQQIQNKGWDCIVAIQSNNLFDHPDHVNCVYSDSHMMKKYPMKEVLFHGELQLIGFKRVMVIGKP